MGIAPSGRLPDELVRPAIVRGLPRMANRERGGVYFSEGEVNGFPSSPSILGIYQSFDYRIERDRIVFEFVFKRQWLRWSYCLCLLIGGFFLPKNTTLLLLQQEEVAETISGMLLPHGKRKAPDGCRSLWEVENRLGEESEPGQKLAKIYQEEYRTFSLKKKAEYIRTVVQRVEMTVVYRFNY